MPARERYFPGTQWKIKDLPEIPVEYRGLDVIIFTELQQEEAVDLEHPGDLYTWAYPEGGTPVDDLIKVEDVFWLE